MKEEWQASRTIVKMHHSVDWVGSFLGKARGSFPALGWWVAEEPVAALDWTLPPFFWLATLPLQETLSLACQSSFLTRGGVHCLL